MDTKKIGLHCVKLGGGRLVKEDIVDPSVGFVFHKKIGDRVKAGDPILTIYHHENQNQLAKNIEDNGLGSGALLYNKSYGALDGDDDGYVYVLYFEYKTYRNQTYKIKETVSGGKKAIKKER